MRQRDATALHLARTARLLVFCIIATPLLVVAVLIPKLTEPLYHRVVEPLNTWSEADLESE